MTQAVSAAEMRARREELIERFESAWARGEAPRLDEYLAEGGADRTQLLIELVFADLECRLKRGEAARVEAYLRDHPELVEQAAAVVDLIVAEHAHRSRREPRLAWDEFPRRFPQYAEALQAKVRPAAPVELVAEQSTSVTGASDLKSPNNGPTTRIRTRAAPWPSQIGPYRVEGELGRGGAGVVLLARDTAFGRALAIKLLLDPDDADLARRFLDEAQLTARLQHPGVAPVHDRGVLPDGRPYFTMKLIDGLTFAELLKSRTSPLDELHRMLAIFAQVCQTLAYAHNRGVIHRDLKPANIMVGAFGETQVMDWGLAKVVAAGDMSLWDDPRSERTDEPSCPAAVAGDQSGTEPDSMCAADTEATEIGTVLGTPAFMAPEQARGSVDELDARSDVFSLGAILCVILTGKPAYEGPTVADTIEQARRGDMAGAHTRLAQSGADRDLVDLAERCLQRRREDRPAHAGLLADALTAYEAGVAQRLHAVELERAAAEIKAREERKRRRLRGTLAAAIGLLVLVGGGAAWWQERQAEQRRTELSHQETTLRQGISAALDEAAARQQESRWAEAQAILDQAKDRLGDNPQTDLRQRLDQAIEHGKLVTLLDDIRLRKATLVEGRYDRRFVDPDYCAAFARAGLGTTNDDAGVVAKRIGALPPPIRAQVVAALDDWAGTIKGPKVGWLLEVARQAEPDPEWGDQLRVPANWNDRDALEKLAAQARVEKLSPALLTILAGRVADTGGDAGPLLLAAQARHLNDFWINFELARVLSKAQPQEALGYYRAALALRPRSPVVLNNLGNLLWKNRRFVDALSAFDKALAIEARYAVALSNRGLVLNDLGRYDEAITVFEKAIKQEPMYAYPHLGKGLVLLMKRQPDAALVALHEALARDPNDPKIHYNLGNAFWKKGRLDDAQAAYEKALALDADYDHAHLGRGSLLQMQGRLDDAIAEFETALGLSPKFADAHINLGNALAAKDLHGEAIAEYQKALAIDPKSAKAHFNFGNALCDLGRFNEACAKFEAALPLFSATDPDRASVERSLQACRRMLKLQRWLPAILDGKSQPEAASSLELADLCRRSQLPHAAVRYYRAAFALEPPRADRIGLERRQTAACAAAPAAAGKGNDAAGLDDEQRVGLRRQALAWLRDDLADWALIFAKGNADDRRIGCATLRRWQSRANLAWVRGDALKTLPEAEQAEWRRLWSDVAALLEGQ